MTEGRYKAETCEVCKCKTFWTGKVHIANIKRGTELVTACDTCLGDLSRVAKTQAPGCIISMWDWTLRNADKLSVKQIEHAADTFKHWGNES